mmetsp:Transcript_17684/g.70985  ORF Transcript_17684/g.70985 Transcript_17684/m.70985 type:complete len:374 (-) Transcript_17684:10-1131(-)
MTTQTDRPSGDTGRKKEAQKKSAVVVVVVEMIIRSREEHRSLLGEEGLDLAVHDEDQRRAHRAERVGAGALEERAEALVGDDLAEAIERVLVHPFFLRLIGLHLQPASDGVERVGRIRSRERRGLRAAKLRGEPENTFVFLVRVDADERVVDAEVRPAERDNPDDRNAEPVVQTEEARRPRRRLDEAVHEPGKLLFARADVGREARARVIERIDDAQRARAREPARGHVDEEKLAEIRLARVFREERLDRVLERKVEGLRREIAQHVDEVAAPKRPDPLLRRHARERVQDPSVARDLARNDLRVRVLRLDDELDALNRGRRRLGDGARHAAREEVHHEVRLALLRHGRARDSVRLGTLVGGGTLSGAVDDDKN